jgi:hypothetical protein
MYCYITSAKTELLITFRLYFPLCLSDPIGTTIKAAASPVFRTFSTRPFIRTGLRYNYSPMRVIAVTLSYDWTSLHKKQTSHNKALTSDIQFILHSNLTDFTLLNSFICKRGCFPLYQNTKFTKTYIGEIWPSSHYLNTADASKSRDIEPVTISSHRSWLLQDKSYSINH